MGFELRQACRQQAKLKIGVFGPSGSGKTYSSLHLARGMTGSWEKVAIIDTENGSANLYSHLGGYNVLPLSAPFTPERYIEAINACVLAGVEVIIIDSISHEWEGEGGILDIADEMSKGAKNTFTFWSKITPRHNAFINSILQAPVHIICCGRTKQEYVLNQKENKQGNIVNVPEKVGMKAVTRENFDYEMTIAFDIGINHFAMISKDRSGLFMDRPEFKVSEETGEEIIKWNLSGEKVKTLEEIQNENFSKFFEQLTQSGVISNDSLKEIYEELKKTKLSQNQVNELLEIIKNIRNKNNEKK